MTTVNAQNIKIYNVAKEDEINVAKHGYGSVYFNKTRNCYQAAYYTLESGEKKRKIISASTYEDAMLTLAQLRAGRFAFTSEEEIPKTKVYHKISDIWDAYMEKKKDIKYETRRGYLQQGAIVIKALGDKYIEELTCDDVQEFVTSLTYTNSGSLSSRSRVKQANEKLKAIISYAMNRGYIDRSPYNNEIKVPEGVRRDPRATAYEKDEVERLLKHIKHSESIVMRTLIPCLLLTGMRIGEFLTLGYSDLNREEGTIHVRHSVDKEKGIRIPGSTKTIASERVIPVPPIFFDIIDNWRTYVYKNPKRVEWIKAKGTENTIFSGDKGEVRGSDTIRTDYNNIVKEIGLKRKNTAFHGLRRTYATIMSRSGIKVEIIAKLLGHEPEARDGFKVTREHYINTDDKKIELKKHEAVKKYMKYMGDIFEENIHFTHLRKGKKR